MSDEAKQMPYDVEQLEGAKRAIERGEQLTPAQHAAWLNRPPLKPEPLLCMSCAVVEVADDQDFCEACKRKADPKRHAEPGAPFDEQLEAGHA